MGQYHIPVCIEAEEGLNPHTLGVGLKEGEQGFSTPSTPNAMVALVCARGGNMPADCSQSPIIGRWAGKRVLVQGDYAEDGDIPGWRGPLLSQLYRAMTPVEERKPKREWRSVPLFRDVAREARDFLEAVCNVRYFEQEQTCRDMVPGSKTYGQIVDRWTHTEWVRVKPVARHFGNCGVAEYVIADGYSERDLEWLKRSGMRPIDVQRPPRTADWHGLRPEELAEGQRRVIVNLDTLEYLDPARFGQAPTLAGIVAEPPKDRNLPVLKKAANGGAHIVSVATGLFVMLCHPERRGGGDIPANAAAMGAIDAERGMAARLFHGCDDVKGRWRGNRILGTGEIRYEDWPTTEDVIERGTNISDKVIRYLVAISHY
ncbi:MAG TPA: hypothetical protein VKQ73_10475 [Stellaceae bacterium]|nr:hypothetical protein [Stellaceae bacterium]